MTVLLSHLSSLPKSTRRPWVISANKFPAETQAMPLKSPTCFLLALQFLISYTKGRDHCREQEGLDLLEPAFHGSGQMNLWHVLVGGCGRWDLMTWIILLSPLLLLAMSEHVKESVQLLLFFLRLLVAINSDSMRFKWIYALLYTK